jgi:hypothetical protein
MCCKLQRSVVKTFKLFLSSKLRNFFFIEITNTPLSRKTTHMVHFANNFAKWYARYTIIVQKYVRIIQYVYMFLDVWLEHTFSAERNSCTVIWEIRPEKRLVYSRETARRALAWFQRWSTIEYKRYIMWYSSSWRWQFLEAEQPLLEISLPCALHVKTLTLSSK